MDDLTDFTQVSEKMGVEHHAAKLRLNVYYRSSGVACLFECGEVEFHADEARGSTF
jgi:hypothetical protein